MTPEPLKQKMLDALHDRGFNAADAISLVETVYPIVAEEIGSYEQWGMWNPESEDYDDEFTLSSPDEHPTWTPLYRRIERPSPASGPIESVQKIVSEVRERGAKDRAIQETLTSRRDAYYNGDRFRRQV